MNIESYYHLGVIIKKFSFRGEFLVKLNTGKPEDFKRVPTLFIPTKDGAEAFEVEKASVHKENLLRIQLKGITSEDLVAPLLKKDIYTLPDFLPKRTGVDFYTHEIIGFSVHEETFGYVGVLKYINEQTPQKLFVIEAHGKEVLIPVNKDLIKRVDRPSKTLFLSVADGLIDIYLN